MKLTRDNSTDLDSDYKTAGVKNLEAIITIILKKWWLFLIVGVIAAIAGIYYASTKKIAYQSKLTFALDQVQGESGLMSFAAQFGLNLSNNNDVFAGDNIIEILQSRRIVEQSLLSLDTFENKPFTFIEYFLQQKNKDLPDDKKIKIHFPVEQPRASFSLQQDSLLFQCFNEFEKNYIDVGRPDRKNNIYEVNITNSNEKFTKDFTDTLIAKANRFYIELTTKKSKQTLDILEQRVEVMKGNVNASIGNMAETQDVNLNPAFSEAQVPVLKQQTNIRVYGAAYTELFKNLEMARYQYLQQIPLMQIIDDANYPMKKIKASKLKTGFLFALGACFIAFLIIWLRFLFKIKTNN